MRAALKTGRGVSESIGSLASLLLVCVTQNSNNNEFLRSPNVPGIILSTSMYLMLKQAYEIAKERFSNLWSQLELAKSGFEVGTSEPGVLPSPVVPSP